MKKYILTLTFLALAHFSFAQYFAHGGYDHGFLNMTALNGAIEQFNTRENHSLPLVNKLSGYRVGFGKYSDFSVVELGFGTLQSRQVSKNPALLKETAEVMVNLTSVNAGLGFRPLKRQFHVIGTNLHMGQSRYRYSFGGDFIVPVNNYSLWAEVYGELAFKIRFLLKKEMRDKLFYVFRIRPYYKFYQPVDLRNFQMQFNNDSNAQFGDVVTKNDHFGFQVSLAIPFLNKDELDYYKKGGKADAERLRIQQERLRKKADKNKGENPRGVL